MRFIQAQAVLITCWICCVVANASPRQTTLSSLSPAAKASISAALGREIPGYTAAPELGGYAATNSKQALTVDFTSAGIQVHSGSSNWGLTLRGYGRGTMLQRSQAIHPTASNNRVEYRRGALTEWYVNGPAGLEQGFTIDHNPMKANGQPLTLALDFSGHVAATLDENRRGLNLISAVGNTKFRYSGLNATDADGKELSAWLELRGQELLLNVNDAKVRYPVMIDPWVEADLTALDGQPADNLGIAVSINSNTVAVGAPQAVVNGNVAQGAVYVFVEPSGGWANMTQTAKLTASDGATGSFLGFSVSVSGSTIVAGAPGGTVGTDSQQGAAYVFVEPAGGWTDSIETAKLTASDGVALDALGSSISIDGSTVIAGAPQASINKNAYQGAAYIFVAPANGWNSTTQTAKLTASTGLAGNGLGTSVSISGNTAVAGAPGVAVSARANQGAAYVYVQPTNGWADMTETAQLTVSTGRANNNLGLSVGINGNTVVAGALYGTDQTYGSAFVFVEPVSGWANTSTFTAELTTPAGIQQEDDFFAQNTAINGSLIVVGAPNSVANLNETQGAAYIFTEPSGGWVSTSQSVEIFSLGGFPGDAFGTWVATDGTNVVSGAQGSNNAQGTASVFVSQ
jgi:hypothetical protein